ncbi:MAG: extracellular solute-binding protein [Firmicutes bacterium]|nr:extracellular solute-binding protein [Bacillota bacterium]
MKAKRVLALLLAMLMAVSLLSACTKQEASQNESAAEAEDGEITVEPLTLPLTAEKKELTVWLLYSGSIMSDLNEIEGIKKMEELTNVHINWIPIEQNQVSEKLGILLSSGTYPDIIYPGISYPGGVEKGVADGVIYPDHDTLIKKYMPNYLNLLSQSEEAAKEAKSDNGKMLTVKNIVGEDYNVKSEGTYQGVAYRKDILDSMGIEEPKSIDEWHDVLVKCKEAGMDTPFMLNTNGGSFLSLAWGAESIVDQGNPYLQVDGNKIVASVMTDGFGEYLDTMRAWYAEGLIDPNFTSFNYYLDTPGSVENNQHVMYSLILSAFTGNNYFQMHMVNNESEYLQPIVPPSAIEGVETVQAGRRVIAKDEAYITTACKDPVLAAKWLDFQYSQEGELLNWYGIEDVTYTMDAEGHPQFTDLVLKNEKGLPPSQVMEQYALNWGNCWLGKHNTVASEKVATAAAGGSNQQKAAVDIWSAPAKNVEIPMGITLTEEENDEISQKVTAVRTMIEEYMIKYIIGTDNTDFETFKAQLNEYGYQDIIDTYQTAFDRYNAR